MWQEKKIVTCFLESNSEILILRRSEQVGTYQGKWAGVSGYIENSADEQAFTEIREETGLSEKNLKLVKRGELLIAEDEKLQTRWIVHPYLFHITDRRKINIDWEHKESRWIKPAEISNYETVPKLKEALNNVL